MWRCHLPVDRSFVERNRAQTARIRTLAERLSDEELNTPVGQHWTVGVTLAHLAFWDERVLQVLEAADRDGRVSAPTIDIAVNDISLPLWRAIPPREAARIALDTAERLDRRLESLPSQMLEQVAAFNMRYVLRAVHRAEHLDEVDRALST